jgi:hypothetical protein
MWQCAPFGPWAAYGMIEITAFNSRNYSRIQPPGNSPVVSVTGLFSCPKKGHREHGEVTQGTEENQSSLCESLFFLGVLCVQIEN